jgi:Spy/CpxP family protein refolding chaperone
MPALEGVRTERRTAVRNGIGVFGAGVLLLAAHGAWAKGRVVGKGMFWGACFGPRAAKVLKLTPEERGQIGKLRDAHRQKATQLRDQIQAKRQESRQIWKAESPDRQAILAKHAEIDPLRQQLREARIDARLAAYNLLNPEQRARVREMRCWGGHRGPWW